MSLSKDEEQWIDEITDWMHPLHVEQAKATIEKKLVEARNQYPWAKIAQHGVYPVPITDLDGDPTGETIEYQECYILPKKWVDAELQGLGEDGQNG